MMSVYWSPKDDAVYKEVKSKLAKKLIAGKGHITDDAVEEILIECHASPHGFFKTGKWLGRSTRDKVVKRGAK